MNLTDDMSTEERKEMMATIMKRIQFDLLMEEEKKKAKEKEKEMMHMLRIIQEPILPPNQSAEPEKHDRYNRKTYLMKDDTTGLYKIGKSNNPKFREKTLQSQKPNINLVKIWNDDIEGHLHKLYHRQRIRGEWFHLNPIQIRYICTHYK